MIFWLALLACIWLAIVHRRTLESGRLAGILAVSLRSGCPPRQALSQAADFVDNPVARRALKDAAQLLDHGGSLSEALTESRVPLPRSFIDALRLAEQAGGVLAFLEAASERFHDRAVLRGRQMMLTIYPLLVALVLVETAVFVAVYILPTFVSLFEGMGLNLPLPTKILIFVVKGLRHSELALSLAAGVALLAGGIVLARRRRLPIVARLVGGIPFFGTLQMVAGCEEAAATLGSLLTGGLALPAALQATGGTLDDPRLAAAFMAAAREVERGETLSAALGRQPVVPRLFTWTCALGERTEALGEVLLDLSGYYRDRAARMASQGLRLWEPLLVASLGLMVSVYLFALYLPIYQLIGSIG